MVRINRDVDLPSHFETSPMLAWVVAAGWSAAVVAIAAGITVFVRAGSEAGEAIAALAVVFGSILVVLLVQCRRYEVLVGERLTKLRSGPFRRTFPTGSVTGVNDRPASSWRRLYAPSELVLTLSVETRPLVVPTRDPDELGAALIRTKPETNARVWGSG